MPHLELLLRHGIVYGATLSGLMCLMFIGIACVNPEIWLKDYPPDIREKFGPMSPKALRQRQWLGVPVFGLMVGILVYSLATLARTLGRPLTFLDAFLDIFFVMLVFNLVDLIVLDWLVFVAIRPRLIVLPGTEGMAGYGDYGFHFRAFLKGLAGSVVLGLIVAGVTALWYGVGAG